MRLVVRLLTLSLVCVSLSQAQPPEEAQKEAMARLSWWVGHWTGTSWTMGPSGKRDTAVMAESVSPALHNTLLLVEGVGLGHRDPAGKSDTVHHAFAILSFDKGRFRWQSWKIPGGYYQEGVPQVGNRSFVWSMDVPRGQMRYTIALDDQGRWVERGEFSADGKGWSEVFGMRLRKE